ncbi:hypothetical protein GCM10023067_51320 [Aminobacter aganoensis]
MDVTARRLGSIRAAILGRFGLVYPHSVSPPLANVLKMCAVRGTTSLRLAATNAGRGQKLTARNL